ncbi:hypothetical protein CVT91_03445 [Candidatus Atribacteria bacterium HGW-Atribacteria-1]|nr:MAG: hypothetical protein CVT91_03445 [Candidatus Atribacteria bacterium HGW-Atribacteria-1]
MIRKILLAIVLIFLITGIGFASQDEIAFKNEPAGFRGLKWGDAPTEDMKFLGEINSSYNLYYRKDDKKNIGSAKLDNIFYRFNLYSNQFYDVSATFFGEANYDILKIIFEEKFGKPTLKLKDGYSLIWNGENAKISLTFNSKEWKGFFMIISTKILPERPEDNKQKEVEKAEEDF